MNFLEKLLSIARKPSLRKILRFISQFLEQWGDYKVLSQMVLEVSVRIRATDGAAITEDDKTAFVNLPLHSIFRECQISLNQKVINSDTGNNYAYKAYLDTLIRFPDTDPGSWMQPEGYFPDTVVPL